jgi:hypothetical protein
MDEVDGSRVSPRSCTVKQMSDHRSIWGLMIPVSPQSTLPPVPVRGLISFRRGGRVDEERQLDNSNAPAEPGEKGTLKRNVGYGLR